MGWEINVSRNGHHLFATHQRSLNTATEEQAVALAKEIQEKFPDCKIKLTMWVTQGSEVSF